MFCKLFYMHRIIQAPIRYTNEGDGSYLIRVPLKTGRGGKLTPEEEADIVEDYYEDRISGEELIWLRDHHEIDYDRAWDTLRLRHSRKTIRRFLWVYVAILSLYIPFIVCGIYLRCAG